MIRGPPDCLQIEAEVRRETLVLGGNDGEGEMVGNLLGGHPAVLRQPPFAARHIAGELVQHEGADRRWHDRQHGSGKIVRPSTARVIPRSRRIAARRERGRFRGRAWGDQGGGAGMNALS